MRRAAPVLLVVAAAVGLGIGLFFTWVVAPVEMGDSTPDSLHIEDKLVYLALVGDLYAYEQDLPRAERRLADLDLTGDGEALAKLIEEHLDGGGRPEEVRNLARLAETLGASGGVLSVFAAVPTAAPNWTPTARPQAGASPTVLPSITPAPSFRLVEKTAVCAAPGQPGQIAVWVQDQDGNQLAGVEIVVSWATGQDRFFTGLWPEQGDGYADFSMSPDVEYEVTLAAFKGEVAQGLTSGLAPDTCPTGTVALDWRLVFAETP
jgi:hypothetical protein